MKIFSFIMLIFLITASCKKESQIPTGELELVNSYIIDVPELSG